MIEVPSDRVSYFQRLKHEEGSALVLVMFLVLMLTILGLAVMGATIGGAQITETRESDVQSLHLAQKGLDEATAYIQSQLKDVEDIDPDTLEGIFSSLDKKNLNVTTELGTLHNTASGEIQEIKYSGKESISPVDDKYLQSRKYYIDVTTSAVVNGVNRKLQQRITLDSYPDFLKYAFGSGETLRLNGAPLLRGNIYAGKQLVITDTADYTYKGVSRHQPSVYPTVMQQAGSGEASGEIHVQSWDSILYANGSAPPSGISPLSPLTMQNTKKLDDILSVTPDKVKIKEQKKFVEINVEESFWDKVSEALGTDVRSELRAHYVKAADGQATAQTNLNDWLKLYNTGSYTHLKKPDFPVKAPISADATEEQKNKIEADYEKAVYDYHDILNNQLTNLNKSAIFDTSLQVDNVDYKQITFSSEAKQGINGINPKWLIIAGDLIIDNFKPDFLKVKGNILVTGNLIIRGNVEFDATVFVLGKTTVEDAKIHGLIEGGNEKELLVISKHEILITRIDSFSQQVSGQGQNTADEMKAFFYTDTEGMLYGVGSKFWLNGGFFAKGNLTVNAVVGQVDPPDAANVSAGFTFKTQQSKNMDARFIIDYNYKIYADQQASLPRVKGVSMSVSPMKLVK
ncbi:pilus assembly PilX N-terminal domain-containing protein [Paenibacillus sp. FSL R7-0331]|uniref:pilus assembly PilX N-terminal domain-containing protein n=1 Tax=Paenibacillus sp. FSL R7-0331 TaxID=1536773 RepID=UPI0004F79748|nr:pilus assembly PilX N-terminal domain-containing protein [Paenibacillus sp. FSL R7-0331]AIQ55132.1 hypothetical protein R70331_29030 [Paenibacillus sp. FSL R7-0331]